MKIYDKTITVYNKLKASDNKPDNKDVYYKHTISNCGWYTQSISAVTGTQVSMSQTFTVLIPFLNNFLPYEKWKNVVNKQDYVTINTGDLIILGDVEETFTPMTITKESKKYEPNVCNVRHINILPKRYNTKIQIQIEGV